MFRFGNLSTSRVVKHHRHVLQNHSRKAMSTQSSGSRAVKTVLVIGASVAAGCAGTIAYAHANDAFRKKLRDKLPPALSQFEWVLGSSRGMASTSVETHPVDLMENALPNSTKAIEEAPEVLVEEDITATFDDPSDETPSIKETSSADAGVEVVIVADEQEKQLQVEDDAALEVSALLDEPVADSAESVAIVAESESDSVATIDDSADAGKGDISLEVADGLRDESSSDVTEVLIVDNAKPADEVIEANLEVTDESLSDAADVEIVDNAKRAEEVIEANLEVADESSSDAAEVEIVDNAKPAAEVVEANLEVADETAILPAAESDTIEAETGEVVGQVTESAEVILEITTEISSDAAEVEIVDNAKPAVVVDEDNLEVADVAESSPIEEAESPALMQNKLEGGSEVAIPTEQVVDNVIGSIESTHQEVVELEDILDQINIDEGAEPAAAKASDVLQKQLTEGDTPAIETAPEQLSDVPEQPTEQQLRDLEVDRLADKAATTLILDNFLGMCAMLCEEAADAVEQAVRAVERYTSLKEDVLRNRKSRDEETLETIHSVYDEKNRLVEAAEETYSHAVKELVHIEMVVDQIKKSKGPEDEHLVILEEKSAALKHSIEEAIVRVRESVTAARVMDYFDAIIATSSSKADDLLADSQDWQLLTADEQRHLAARVRAHVRHLVSELQDERDTAREREERAVAAARLDVGEQVRRASVVELELKLDELQIRHHAELIDVKTAHDDEMKKQLKLQAAAHVQHLAEALSYMEKQLKYKHEATLHEKMTELEEESARVLENQQSEHAAAIAQLRDEYNNHMSVAAARVHGLEGALDGRAETDKRTRRAQELALACDSLVHAMKYGDGGNPRPLASELQNVVMAHGGDAAIDDLASAFPSQAASRGVFSEQTLLASFERIGKICRRLSLVDDTRNSLFIYFLSFLKSLLTISTAQNQPPPADLVDELDVFAITSYANYCLQRGDLERAARFVNQLTGEPRKVAEGWLKEVRLYLETRQTVEALAAVSNSIVIASQLCD